MKRTILFLLSAILCLDVIAFDIEKDGIFYNFIDGKYEVSVTGSSKSEIVIPNRIFYEGKEYVVTAINQGAFYDRRDLLSVQIGDSVRDIMSQAFFQCERLETLKFGKMVRTLGSSSFSCCYKLESIRIPDSVSVIGEGAFANCSNLKYVEMNNKVNWIKASAFSECRKIEHVVFKKPQLLTNENTSYTLYFSESAFQNCTGIRRVDIEDLAAWCNTSGNGWPSSPLTYGPDLYLNGKLITKLVIPESASNIGNYSFQNCPSIISVELPEKIWVSESSFRYSNIHSLRLRGGESTYLSGLAFSNCSNLKKVIADSSTPANISENTFNSDTYYKGTLYVPIGAKGAYKAATGWSQFSNIKEGIPDPNLETYVLSITSEYGGTVSYDTYNVNNDNQAIYVDQGTEAKISLLPYSEYAIDKVTLNGVDITSDIVDNQYTIDNISDDVQLNVSFKLNPLYLTIQQTGAATIKQEVKAREQYTISISPSEGWKITSVKFNDDDVTNQVLENNSYTTPRITQNSKLVITQEPFQIEPSKYTVSCTISEGGYIVIADQQHHEGHSETQLSNGFNLGIRYEIKAGYALKNLFVDGIDVSSKFEGNNYDYGQINKDVAICAIFIKEEKKQYNLEIQDTESGLSFMRVPEGQTVKYTINNVKGWKLKSVQFNEQDVTSDVKDNVYVTPEIVGNSLLSIIYEKDEEESQMTINYDLNGDGKVNAEDIVKFVDVIMGKNKE